MNILIDAFGGDNAPLEVIRGGARAVQELGVTVTLVGDEQKIRACAEKNRLPLDGMEILHAPAVFDIHEEPTSLLKQHADTSMACRHSTTARVMPLSVPAVPVPCWWEPHFW